MLGADAVRGAQPLVGVRRRHADVDDRDVGAVHRHVAEEVVGRSRLRDHLVAGLREQPRDPLAEEDGVVGEHDPHAR